VKIKIKKEYANLRAQEAALNTTYMAEEKAITDNIVKLNALLGSQGSFAVGSPSPTI
jgi:hypothetical protein